MDKEKPVITVTDLYKYYKQVKAVDGISLEVFEGEIFGIVGPNGAGKTTLVECIEGLRIPDRGKIEVLGMDMIKGGEETRRRLRRHIGIQLQAGRLPDRIKVLEAVNLFASFYGRPVSPIPLLKNLGLGDKINSYFQTLSGGQKQRLFIVLSLINDGRLIFFDELTTGLDPHARRAIWDLVEEIRDEGKTIVLVTHFMEEAERLCDRVAIVDQGNVIALDTPANLIKGLDIGVQVSFSLNDTSILKSMRNMDAIKRIEENGDKVIVYCSDKRGVASVINTLTESDISYYDLSIKDPALEDVFMSLTGREMRD